MDFLNEYFEIPRVEFTEEDLQELFEFFDPEASEGAQPPAAAAPAVAKNSGRPPQGTFTESLHLLSQY